MLQWTKHDGLAFPSVNMSEKVVVKFRCGITDVGRAGIWSWQWKDDEDDGDIIAYTLWADVSLMLSKIPNGDWIQWEGDGIPFYDGDVLVDVVLQSGDTLSACFASDLNWSPGMAHSIVKYRVIGGR